MSKKPKRASTKKAGHKRLGAKKAARKKTRRLTPIPHGVGVVNTITIKGTPLGVAFENAVKSACSDAKVKYSKATYDGSVLREAVAKFNTDQEVGLIVFVGGVTSALNETASSKRFLVLVGGTPGGFLAKPGVPELYYGGVNLDTYGNNDKRIQYLLSKPGIKTAQDVGLIYNPNSVSSGNEREMWKGAAPIAVERDTAGRNDKTKFKAAFDKASQANLKAVVISADGFFQDNKNDLIDAANTFSGYVCYPFHEYANRNSGHEPKAGQHTKHGPRLTKAYEDLGKKAGKILSLTNPSPSKLDKVEIGDPVDG